MQIEKVISELQAIMDEHGNIEVYLQSGAHTPDVLKFILEHPDTAPIVAYDSFFIVAEDYDEGTACNLRWWPY